MKLWIIYKNGIGFSKLVAEMIQDRLEDYIEVNVGDIKMIYPDYIIEEQPDCLIIGDLIIDETPSSEIKRWIQRYGDVLNKKKNTLKVISGFYVTLSDVKVNSWSNFLQENITVEIFIQPILGLKLDKTGLILESSALELIKDYSNKWTNYIINN